jgi:hypothetical protein
VNVKFIYWCSRFAHYLTCDKWENQKVLNKWMKQVKDIRPINCRLIKIDIEIKDKVNLLDKQDKTVVSTEPYPEGDSITVALCGMTPAPTHQPSIVESHVEWQTECADTGKVFTICLEATDSCGTKDTCYFDVTVYNRPPELTCPEDDSIHAPGNLIVTGKEIGGPVVHHRPIQLNVQETSHAGDEMDESANLPDGFTLFQNQPNPFNPETQISYFLPQDCQVRLTIYNLLGQRVKTLYEGHQGAGIQTLTWDGTNDQGQKLSSGIYFYRLQAEQFQQTKKMVLMK